MSLAITDDPFLLRVAAEASEVWGSISAIEMTDSWEGPAPYCGEGTCEMEMVCVTVTLADGSKRFQLREFAEWMRRYGDRYGDPIDDEWETVLEHWCRYHQ